MAKKTTTEKPAAAPKTGKRAATLYGCKVVWYTPGKAHKLLDRALGTRDETIVKHVLDVLEYAPKLATRNTRFRASYVRDCAKSGYVVRRYKP